MSEELERTRKALGEAIAWLQRLSTLGGTSSVGNEMAREALAKMDALLAPPPEFEEVEESAGWVNIYPDGCSPSGYACGQSRPYATKEDADDHVASDRIGCQELRVKVKRHVKRPVVKSCPLILTAGGWTAGGLDALSFKGDKLPLTGTFTWRE